MTFEKAAAFAFTDIDLSGNLFEQDFFLIMVVQIGEQHQQTFPVTLYRRKCFGLWLSILIQGQPDPGEQDLDLKIPARSLGRRNFPDFVRFARISACHATSGENLMEEKRSSSVSGVT